MLRESLLKTSMRAAVSQVASPHSLTPKSAGDQGIFAAPATCPLPRRLL
jgi:hypothetical protein